METYKNTKIKFKDESSFYLDCMDEDQKLGARVRIQIDILDKAESEKCKVG